MYITYNEKIDRDIIKNGRLFIEKCNSEKNYLEHKACREAQGWSEWQVYPIGTELGNVSYPRMPERDNLIILFKDKDNTWNVAMFLRRLPRFVYEIREGFLGILKMLWNSIKILVTKATARN